MWQIKPRKHEVDRPAKNSRVKRYPFEKMIVTDFFEVRPTFKDAAYRAALKANDRLAPRRFSVTIVNDKVVCTRVK
jgi:hypothetical protein